MRASNKQKMATIDRNFSLVVDFLNRKLSKTSVQLSEAPCYYYLGNDFKLEVTVYSNPRIATIDIRMINLKDDSREPSFECSYELTDLSIAEFEKAIDNLIIETN